VTPHFLFRLANRRVGTAVAALTILAGVSLSAPPVHAEGGPSVIHATVVSATPQDNTPHALDGEVHAFTAIDGYMYAGGTFTQVRADNTQVVINQPYLFRFDATTGKIDAGFAPVLDDEVDALAAAADGKSIYIGGKFKTVNGLSIKRLARLDAATGTPSEAFKPNPSGQVRHLERVGANLYLSGAFSKVKGTSRQGLAVVNADSGKLSDAANFTFTISSYAVDKLHLNVSSFAISPDGTQLVAVGNFGSVNGLAREMIFRAQLTTSTATLSDWTTNAFSCPSKLVQHDVAFSPDGSYLIVVNTGVGFTGLDKVCDAVARFETASTGASNPTWINHTGNDSIWSVAVTGTAVYVGGHQRYMDRTYWGYSGSYGAVSRPGLAALDPATGIPYSWNPTRTRGQAVFDIFPTANGIWIGSDTDSLANSYHGRLGFFPITGGAIPARWSTASFPGTVYVDGTTAGQLSSRSFDGTTGSSKVTIAGTGTGTDDWSAVRCAAMSDGVVWSARSDGTLTRRTFTNTALGLATTVSLNGLENSLSAASLRGLTDIFKNCTTMFAANGRLYYASSGDSKLYWRSFNPESGILGPREYVADTGTNGVTYGTAGQPATLAGTALYHIDSTGNLHKASWSSNGVVAGTDVVVSGPATGASTWASRLLFGRAD
jgi:hypothetical protein